MQTGVESRRIESDAAAGVVIDPSLMAFGLARGERVAPVAIEKSFEGLNFQGLGEQEPLALVAVLALERSELVAILDSLGERFEIEGPTEPNERLNQGR